MIIPETLKNTQESPYIPVNKSNNKNIGNKLKNHLNNKIKTNRPTTYNQS